MFEITKDRFLQVDETLDLFNELQLQHHAVATKTKTLHDACDRLVRFFFFCLFSRMSSKYIWWLKPLFVLDSLTLDVSNSNVSVKEKI